MTLNGFYVTISWLSLCLIIVTILLIILVAEMRQSNSCKKRGEGNRKRRRNNYRAKLMIVFVTFLLIATAEIGCLNDLIHVIYCSLSSNTRCSNGDDINRMAADIAYFIAYCSFYFIIVSRLYVTFINTRYRVSPCTMFILFILMIICYGSCGIMLILGYFNDDHSAVFNNFNNFSLITFLIFDFLLNASVLTLFIRKMNKVIVNKTYRIDTEDLDDGTGKTIYTETNNHRHITGSNQSNISAASYISDTVSSIDTGMKTHSFSLDKFPELSQAHSVDANEYDHIGGLSWSVLDNKQITLTTIVTRLAVLTLMAIFCNILFALFLVYYYLYIFLTGYHSKRDYGITYCARALIAAINSLLMILNFNFCHRKYYKGCRRCHKCLFRCFVKTNTKQIKQLSMHLEYGDTNTNISHDITANKTINFTMNSRQSLDKLSYDSSVSDHNNLNYYSD